MRLIDILSVQFALMLCKLIEALETFQAWFDSLIPDSVWENYSVHFEQQLELWPETFKSLGDNTLLDYLVTPPTVIHDSFYIWPNNRKKGEAS